MRPLHEIALDRRIRVYEAGADGLNGHVLVGKVALKFQASIGMGWDHVSVSGRGRCPTWNEMEAVKRLFFEPREVVMQLHVAESEHINVHPYCLHLWRPHDQTIPLPDNLMV